MKNITLLLFLFPLFISAQQKSIVKEKEVSIDIEKNNDGQRNITIISLDGDEEQVWKWVDNGSIPDKIKEELKAANIDINILDENIVEEDFKSNINKHEYRKEKMRDIKRKGNALNRRNRKDLIEFEPRGENRHFFNKKNNSDVYLGLQISQSEKGIKIDDIQKDSPAEKSKIKIGDIIKRINGARMKSSEDLHRFLSFYEPNDKVTIEVLRKNKTEKIKVNLGKRPKRYRL